MSRGLFLAFEGVEGSGKSTQARMLEEALRATGREVVHAREPGSTPLGEKIRALVLDPAGAPIPAKSELFLMLAARAAFVENVVLPALQSGSFVIADRFELSTLAYQGAGRGLDIDEVVRANRFATGDVRPDVTILLDLPAQEGARRQSAAAKSQDRMESEAADFHIRVGSGYRELADKVAGLIRIDAAAPIEEVHRQIVARLSQIYPETFPSGRVIS